MAIKVSTSTVQKIILLTCFFRLIFILLASVNPLKINPMDSILFWLVPVASVLALCFAYYFHKQMMKESEGTPQMIKIAAAVRKGAMSYLKQQYKIVGCVFLGLVILFSIMAYGFHVQNAWVPIAFLTGGFFSGLSGFLGMKTATYASARTANAARGSLNAGLRIAFRSGAVMGLVVVGLGLLDISFWYLLLNEVIPADALTPTHKLCVITTTMLTFGMGASTQALFARVGGGIYTKAADVGADLVGKVEAGIPEDDPRNPAGGDRRRDGVRAATPRIRRCYGRGRRPRGRGRAVPCGAGACEGGAVRTGRRGGCFRRPSGDGRRPDARRAGRGAPCGKAPVRRAGAR